MILSMVKQTSGHWDKDQEGHLKDSNSQEFLRQLDQTAKKQENQGIRTIRDLYLLILLLICLIDLIRLSISNINISRYGILMKQCIKREFSDNT